MRRSIPALMAIILLACALVPLPSPAREQAQAEPAEYGLVIEFAHGSMPLPDALFSLYRVGDFDGAGAIALDADYAARFAIGDIRDQRGWAAAAREMAAYVKEAGVEPLARGSTGQDGRVSFGAADGLSRGAYLVVGEDVHYQGASYSSLPFLLTLPSWDPEEGSWLAQVLARPKPGETTPDPVPSPTPVPAPDPNPASGPDAPSSASPLASLLPNTGDELVFWVLLLAAVFLGFAIWGTSRQRE